MRKIQSLRHRKMQKEEEILRADGNLHKLEAHMEEVSATCNRFRHDLEMTSKDKTALERKLFTSEQNIDMMVRLRQGQDEVEQQAVVTDYTNAVLIPVSIVHAINQEIQRLGAEQAKVLLKIKHFRKSINLMDWENQYMEMQARDLEEYYTDLQLLHVTKDLQSAIKGNFGKQEMEYSMKIEARIKITQKVHMEKCSKFRLANAKLKRHVRDRDEENDRLKQRVRDLQDSVAVRESIFKSHLENHGQDDAAENTASAMKRVILRRRLIDLARLQTEEIDFLRQELDRLRQRTFPSFAQSQNPS